MTNLSKPHRRARLLSLPLAACLLSVAAAAGCGDPGADWCDTPLVDKPRVTCSVAGSVQVSASGDFALPATAAPIAGASCISADGACSNSPSFYFQSAERPDAHYLKLVVNLWPNQRPGRYLLGGADAPTVRGSIYNASYASQLHAVSGTLIVTRSDRDALQVAFAMDVDSEDGLHHLALTGGRVDVTDCKVETVPTCILD